MKKTYPAIKSGSADRGNVATQPAGQPLKICIVFDDDASARSAEVLIRHTASDLPCDVQLFAFEELDPPGPVVTAARKASVSNILVVPVADDLALPGPTRWCLGSCLGSPDPHM